MKNVKGILTKVIAGLVIASNLFVSIPASAKDLVIVHPIDENGKVITNGISTYLLNEYKDSNGDTYDVFFVPQVNGYEHINETEQIKETNKYGYDAINILYQPTSNFKWSFENSKWYYKSIHGDYKKGLLMDNATNLQYYLDPTTGEMKTGWQKIHGDWFYFGNDGALVQHPTFASPDGTYYIGGADGAVG